MTEWNLIVTWKYSRDYKGLMIHKDTKVHSKVATKVWIYHQKVYQSPREKYVKVPKTKNCQTIKNIRTLIKARFVPDMG